MCKGFVKIPRRIYEEKQWNVKRVYSELDAFYDIYASAYTRDRTEPDGTKIKRNQLSISYRTLADRWLWNQMKVKRFVQSLEKKGYIQVESNKFRTIVTIIDFGTDVETTSTTSVTPSVTQPVTPSVTPLLHPKPFIQRGSEGVGVTPTVTPSVTQSVTPTVTLNKEYKKEEYIEKEINKEKDSKSKSFVKPTIEEIDSYLKANGYMLSAEQFYDHYESNGWMVGKTHMKDWKAAIRTWNRNNGKYGRQEQSSAFILKDNTTDKFKDGFSW